MCRRISAEEYAALVREGVALLEGNSKKLLHQLEESMMEASEELQFERAALLRDRIKAIRALGEKQKVVAGTFEDLGRDCICAGTDPRVCRGVRILAVRCRIRSTQ